MLRLKPGVSPISALALLSGIAVLFVVILEPVDAKVAIVESTFGLLLMLFGVYWLNTGDKAFVAPESRLLQYLPLFLGIGVNIWALLFSPGLSALALSFGLALIFPLSKFPKLSKNYVVLLTVFYAASIAYNVYYYFPIFIGIDQWSYLSVATAIIRRGHYHDIVQPTDRYFYPFPVMSIASSILSSVTGIDLEISLFIFPGILILLQPLLVYLLSKALYRNPEIGALSAMLLVTESAVTQWINSPIGQSTAESLLLLVLIGLFGHGRSMARLTVVFLEFFTLVALHGAVAITSLLLVPWLLIRGRSPHRGVVYVLTIIFLSYLAFTEVINYITVATQRDVIQIFDFLLSPRISVAGELFAAPTSGVIFVWWGFPVSLALFSILVKKMKGFAAWVEAGLVLLGASFAFNVIAPNLTIDRYMGLTGWIVLAVAGGRTLHNLTRTTRQFLVLFLMIILVSFSAIATPSIAPQFGFSRDPLGSTTMADRAALEWVNTHLDGSIGTDTYSTHYLTFIHYSSGGVSDEHIINLGSNFRLTPRPDYAVFARWSNLYLSYGQGSDCKSLLKLWSSERNVVVNVVYSNSCDFLLTSPVA